MGIGRRPAAHQRVSVAAEPARSAAIATSCDTLRELTTPEEAAARLDAPENSLSGWFDQAFARAGVRPVVVMRTAVTAAAPQLAAAGLGVAVCPASAVPAGLPGAVLPFSPRWTRELVATTRAAPDGLVAQLVADLRNSIADA